MVMERDKQKFHDPFLVFVWSIILSSLFGITEQTASAKSIFNVSFGKVSFYEKKKKKR